MTTRRLPFDLLRFYAAGIDIYFLDHEGEEPPADLSVFLPSIEHVREAAVERGELDDLRAVIDYVLTHDDRFLAQTFDLSLAEIIHTENWQEESVLKDILAFCRAHLWPDAEPPSLSRVANLEMVKTSLEHWRAAQPDASGT